MEGDSVSILKVAAYSLSELLRKWLNLVDAQGPNHVCNGFSQGFLVFLKVF